MEAFKRECEGKGAPAIEDAGIGLLIAAPSSDTAPAAPIARAPDPDEPPLPFTVAEPPVPPAPADPVSLLAGPDGQKDRPTDAPAMPPICSVFAPVDVPDLLLIRLDGMLATRGLAGPNTVTLRLPDSDDHLTLHRRGDAYEISSHFAGRCSYVGSTMSKTKVADFLRAWLRSGPAALAPPTAIDVEAVPGPAPEVEDELPPPTAAELLALPWYTVPDSPGTVLAADDGVTFPVIDPHRDTGLGDAAVVTLAEHIVQLHNAALRASRYLIP
ncbi:hypothetical protein [Azospirillum argentinense]